MVAPGLPPPPHRTPSSCPLSPVLVLTLQVDDLDGGASSSSSMTAKHRSKPGFR